MTDLLNVDWSNIPAPIGESGARHLDGAAVPSISLTATAGNPIDLSRLSGLTIVYAYPMTGKPGVALPKGWDMIPGARGCTPQACAFRDHHAELKELGATHLFGLSTQDSVYQREVAERLHLPFPLLSDRDLRLTTALQLPTFSTAGMTLLQRLTLVIHCSWIIKLFYPVYPPDRNAWDVMQWLRDSLLPRVWTD